MKTEVQIDVQDLEHLGIIAGIVDEITSRRGFANGIVEIIDKEIGTDVREKVSAGQVVKAMSNVSINAGKLGGCQKSKKLV